MGSRKGAEDRRANGQTRGQGDGETRGRETPREYAGSRRITEDAWFGDDALRNGKAYLAKGTERESGKDDTMESMKDTKERRGECGPQIASFGFNSCSQAPPGNTDHPRLCPGAREGGAFRALHCQAEPGNEEYERAR